MTAHIQQGFDPKTIPNLVKQAFDKPPDSAGILQGVRKFRGGRPHIKTHLLPSPKNGNHLIACDGGLEFDMALALELHPDVLRYRGQPIAVPGPRGKDIILDFAINFDSGFGLIDNKLSKQLSRKRVAERMTHLRDLASEVQLPHYIFTEEHLSKEPYKQIRSKLKKGLRCELSPYLSEQLCQCMNHEIISVGDLRRRAIRQGFEPHAIEAAVALELFAFTTNTPWGEHTLIGEKNHEHIKYTSTNWGTVRDICVPL